MQNYDDLLQRRLHHLVLSHDHASQSVWIEFKYEDRPCISRELIEEVRMVQRSVRQAAVQGYQENRADRILFQVIASTDKDVFNLGGDLDYFLKLIEANDENRLREFARLCVDIQYESIRHYDIPFTSIACVSGDALGGGFEAALSANVLVAEQEARFGFPEITFGMFPGMGALSLLTRKVGTSMAQRIIMDRRIYTAAELYEMGIVDILAPAGKGREAVMAYMKKFTNQASGYHGFQSALDRVSPVSYEELQDIAEIWVKNALQLSEKNMRLMSYYARAQSRQDAAFGNDLGSGDYNSA